MDKEDYEYFILDKIERVDAMRIAETITNKQLLEMISKAKSSITNWTRKSFVNENMTITKTWNILGKNYVGQDLDVSVKRNMIYEFGEFLTDELKTKKVKKKLSDPIPLRPVIQKYRSGKYIHFRSRINDETRKIIKKLNFPGVYLFSDSEKIIYVGKSRRLRSRIVSSAMRSVHHINDNIYVSYYKCNSGIDAAILELYMINKHNPFLNLKDFHSGDVTLNIKYIPKISGKMLYLNKSETDPPYIVSNVFIQRTHNNGIFV